MFYETYFRKPAEAPVGAGYDTLALNMRDAGPKKFCFTDDRADIAAGAAYLRELGHKRLVLLGRSIGTNRVLY